MDARTHVVKVTPPIFCIGENSLEVHQICAWTDNYIWVLYDRRQQEVVIIDGPCAEPFLEWMKDHPCRSISIWNTHHHRDHVGINAGLLGTCVELELSICGASSRTDDIPGLTHPLSEGDVLTIAGERFEVWETNGHVDGHLCFVHREVLFCGDTLFAGGCGYLFDGPPSAMFSSLGRLSTLSDHVKVCCAHEYTVDNLAFAAFLTPEDAVVEQRLYDARDRAARGETTLPSTMGMEKATNPFLRVESAPVKDAVEAFVNRELKTPLSVFTEIRKLKDQKIHRG